MNSLGGWIKLHKKLWNHPRAQEPEWVSLWAYLLSHAAFGPYKTKFQGAVIELQPGQLVTGRKVLAEKTGIHESKVQRLLDVMESEHQIEQQTESKSRIITIINWKEYQGEEEPEQEKERELNNKRTTTEQQVNTLKRRIKKNKTLRAFTPTREEIVLYLIYLQQHENDTSSKEETCTNIRMRIAEGKDPFALAVSIYKYAKFQREQNTEPKYWDKASNFFGKKATFERFIPNQVTEEQRQKLEIAFSSIFSSYSSEFKLDAAPTAVPPTQKET